MERPKKFLGAFGVLNIGMVLVVFIYVGMGMMGYWKYGEQIESSITLNFPPTDTLVLFRLVTRSCQLLCNVFLFYSLAQAINILYSIAIYISYGLQGYVPVQIIFSDYLSKHLEGSNHKLLWEYLLRLACVILTCKSKIFTSFLFE